MTGSLPPNAREWGNGPARGTGRDRAAGGAWYPGRDPGAPPPAGAGPSEDLRQLSEREERDLHFNGYPQYNMWPLHELCSPGGCRYRTEAENSADLDAWYRAQDREPDPDEPEAGL
jgi:hypothetical protein